MPNIRPTIQFQLWVRRLLGVEEENEISISRQVVPVLPLDLGPGPIANLQLTTMLWTSVTANAGIQPLVTCTTTSPGGAILKRVFFTANTTETSLIAAYYDGVANTGDSGARNMGNRVFDEGSDSLGFSSSAFVVNTQIDGDGVARPNRGLLGTGARFANLYIRNNLWYDLGWFISPGVTQTLGFLGDTNASTLEMVMEFEALPFQTETLKE